MCPHPIHRLHCIGCTLLLWGSASALCLAQPAPHIGFVYPAGGQSGTSFEVTVGGQYLDDSMGVIVSGEGITAQVLDHNKLPSAQVIDDYRDKLREVQAQLRTLRQGDSLAADQVLPTIRKLLREAGLTEKMLLQVSEYDRRRNDPKQQLNTQIGESVRVKVTISDNAEVGIHHWRLQTPAGISNPMRFVVGQLPEVLEAAPPPTFDLENYRGGTDALNVKRMETPPVTLPVTLNGRILPGEVDEFAFSAKKGEQIVLALHARSLIPYLADAVPGWFQSVVSLHDDAGYEVAYSDGYRFDPDPVLFYKIPSDGLYHIHVHDSIYRGRDDFVYRITLGELPFLTGISPLGATAGSKIELTFQGGNLGTDFKQTYEVPDTPGIILQQATVAGKRSNSIPFQIDAYPAEPEREPNASLGAAQSVKPPVIIDGRIDEPGDADFFRLKGPGNKEMIFEIFARRLGSPMDASLAVFDDDGQQIAFNDDHEDLGSGLTTHHADSRISVKLPPSGACFVRVTDTQHQGGITNAYRLNIHPAKPSFSLRITPSSLNAKPGSGARCTVHALRTDGFDGAITLQLQDAPSGFALSGATVPAGQDHVDISITVPSSPIERPVALTVLGKAEADGDAPAVEAIPAEDMMQAFIYRHLVPVDALLVDVRTPPPPPMKPNP